MGSTPPPGILPPPSSPGTLRGGSPGPGTVTLGPVQQESPRRPGPQPAGRFPHRGLCVGAPAGSSPRPSGSPGLSCRPQDKATFSCVPRSPSAAASPLAGPCLRPCLRPPVLSAGNSPAPLPASIQSSRPVGCKGAGAGRGSHPEGDFLPLSRAVKGTFFLPRAMRSAGTGALFTTAPLSGLPDSILKETFLCYLSQSSELRLLYGKESWKDLESWEPGGSPWSLVQLGPPLQGQD